MMSAATAEKPEGRAVRAMAETLMARGEFSEAVSLVRLGRSKGLWDERLSEIERDGLVAQYRVGEALEQPEMAAPASRLQSSLVAAKVRLLVLAKKDGEARALAEQMAEMDPWTKKNLGAYLGWIIEYARGDLNAARRKMEGMNAGLFDVQQQLMTNDLAGAAKLATEANPPALASLLQVCAAAIAAIAADDEATLKKASSSVFKTLEKGGYWESRAADLLSGKGPCNREALEDVSVDPHDRAAFLLLAAALRPECREEALRQAKLMNFGGEFPSHFVKQGIERLQRR